jgi:hypothetical protein
LNTHTAEKTRQSLNKTITAGRTHLKRLHQINNQATVCSSRRFPQTR